LSTSRQRARAARVRAGQASARIRCGRAALHTAGAREGTTCSARIAHAQHSREQARPRARAQRRDGRGFAPACVRAPQNTHTRTSSAPRPPRLPPRALFTARAAVRARPPH
jgi:hypothetical protein